MHNTYKSCVNSPSSTPILSWEAACKWASVSKNLKDPFYVVDAYQAAFRMLPEILWMGHTINLRHETILRLGIDEVTSTATQTCIGLAEMTAAVEIIEQGIATVFQQILQLKTNVGGLETDEEMNRFQKLSSDIYRAEKSVDLRQVAAERHELLSKIRGKPKLAHFLCHKPYDLLKQAAQGGPIIILNSHKNGCDGIIILKRQAKPVRVAFPKVTLAELESYHSNLKKKLAIGNPRMRGDSRFPKREGESPKPITKFLEELLNWLWTCIVFPVYEALKSVSASLI
jgi:hypothetical protein